jgi:hypothetical protein
MVMDIMIILVFNLIINTTYEITKISLADTTSETALFGLNTESGSCRRICLLILFSKKIVSYKLCGYVINLPSY